MLRDLLPWTPFCDAGDLAATVDTICIIRGCCMLPWTPFHGQLETCYHGHHFARSEYAGDLLPWTPLCTVWRYWRLVNYHMLYGQRTCYHGQLEDVENLCYHGHYFARSEDAEDLHFAQSEDVKGHWRPVVCTTNNSSCYRFWNPANQISLEQKLEKGLSRL